MDRNKDLLIYLVFSSFFGSFILCLDLPFHFENEFDQTVLSDVEEEDVKSEILDWLGLPNPDAKQNWTNDLSGSAPNFLLKMYEMMTNKNLLEKSVERQRNRRNAFNYYEDRLVSPFDEMELHESDNVMTFMTNDFPLFDEPLMKKKLSLMIWFNISQIPEDISLMAAQLKVFKRKTNDTNEIYELSVYAINIQANNEMALTLMSSVKTASHYEGWLQLNVTTAVCKWKSNPEFNQGFYLEARLGMCCNETKNKEVYLPNAGLATTDEKKSFLVAYLKNVERPTSTRTSLHRRSRRRRQNINDNSQPSKKPDAPKSQRNCQRLNFSIDFKKLNWLNWIVAPEKFDSFFCSGDCSFPLNAINTTNHAIIQTLAHLKNPDLPKPCCAPTVLTSIVIIYRVSQDVVNMKKYSNMVVESCGCL